MEVQEELLQLFNVWYGTRYRSKNVDCQNVELPYSVVENQWINLWFAKGEKQKEADKNMSTFEGLVEKFENFEPKFFVESMAMIILYDQIPRNIFRKTARAYAYDHISRKTALAIIDNIDQIAVQYKITVLVSLLHTEDLGVQKRVREICQKLVDYPLYVVFGNILSQLKNIAGNHYDRVINFGRIPERNKYLGRVNTPEELVYLKAIN